MLMFERLLLAHLLADFPFQTNWVYGQKIKSLWGVVFHCGIVTLLNVIFLFPYLHLPQVWEAIAFLLVVHVIIDQYKISLTKQEKELDGILFFLQDQVFHVLSILAAIKWFGLDKLPMTNVPTLLSFYNNDYWLWVAISIIGAAFAGKVLLYYIKRVFWNPDLPFEATPTENLIRAAFTLFAALPGNAWLLILPIAYLNYKIPRQSTGDRYTLWFNPLSAVPVGLLIHYFYP